ncbi:MAG: hypothetical protein WA103_02185 [Minisyncoccales bacterium]
MVKKTKTILIIILTPVVLFLLYMLLLFFSLYRGFGIPRELADSNGEDGLQSLPCDPASSVELSGSPDEPNFVTNGSDLYLHVKKDCNASTFPDGFNAFINPKVSVYIGNFETPPMYDYDKSTIINATKKMILDKGKYSAIFQLLPGSYWLRLSTDCKAILYSCEEGGVSDPKPVWR